MPKCVADDVDMQGAQLGPWLGPAWIWHRRPYECRSLAEKGGEFIVIDAKMLEEHFVLFGRHGALEEVVRFAFGFLALENQGPEDSVVQVVDVGVSLAPRKVVADLLGAGIHDESSIK